MSRLHIRTTELSDIDPLLKLQKEVYPTIAPWQRDQLVHQLEVFPEGQLVAELNGRVVGCASSLVILWDEWADEHTWSEITAAGTFDTHTTAGLTLYGAEVFVDPRLRGMRVGHRLYGGRRQLCRSFNLKRIMACGRLPGYQAYSQQMSVEQYVKKVLWGDFVDPVLSFQLREGFRYCGIMYNYIPEDADSSGHAALIVWLNDRYDPAKKTGLQIAMH